MTTVRRSPTSIRGLRHILEPAGLLACAAVVLAGCASADKTTNTTTSSKASASTTSTSGMVGMNMGAGTTPTPGSTVTPTIKGIKPVPTQVLASTSWQGMKISADAMTAVPFMVFNGTTWREVKPGPKTSFHLMVTLNDAQTHVPIPYASVWATISKGSRIVYDERLWPMISRYMGPHYGNDVSVPGAGTYKLTLLVSPPVSARHLEYQNVWLRPHRANFTFHWKPVS